MLRKTLEELKDCGDTLSRLAVELAEEMIRIEAEQRVLEEKAGGKTPGECKETGKEAIVKAAVEGKETCKKDDVKAADDGKETGKAVSEKATGKGKDNEGKSATKGKDTGEQTVKAEKPTLKDVRSLMVEKSRQGFTEEVRALVRKYGADRLSDVDPSDYPLLMADAEVLGNG